MSRNRVPSLGEAVDDASLVEQAQHFLLVQRALGVVTWVWDVEPAEHGRWYGDLSPLLGLPAGSFDNTLAHFVRCLHAEDVGQFESVFRDCLAGRRDNYRTEQRVVWPDGRWRWLETYGRAERDHTGRTVRMMGVIQDVSERRRAELERRASESRLRGLIDEAPVAIGISHGDEVRYCNPRFLALFGLRDLREAVGRTVGSLIAPSAQAEHAERSRRRALGNALPTTYQLRMCRANGEEFDCEVSLAASAGPQELDTLVFLQDVSEREQARRALQDLNARLEQRVVERTQELARSNAALAEARDAAEAATRAKSQFLANMSHEIRTPLNAIRGLGDLALRDEATPARRHEYLTQIRRASDTLLLLVNDLLDFSRIESGHLEIEQRTFSLDDVVDSVAAAVGLEAGCKGLDLIVDRSPAVPARLVGDPLRLGQILLNLCGNAVKFTERGSVQLRLRATPSARGGVRLRMVVVDTGIGMDLAQLPRLLQPFEQLDAATTRRHGGSGLGLAISRQLAQLMGGSLRAHSRPGHGSRFELCLTLPAADGEPALAPVPAADGPCVVAIDDHAAARTALQHGFAVLGWRAAVVGSVDEALAKITAPPSLVLVARCLRGEDADAAAARLRAAGWTATRLVRVTGCGDESGASRALRCGYDATLAQPLTPRTLRSLMPGGPASVPAPPAPRVLAGRRILLVEDNELNRLVATDLLTDVAGARVTVASDGETALRLLADELPDIVLMDVQMPGLDGYQTVARLRGDPRLASLPVVAMTANATTADRRRCLDAGMNDFVAKPFEPERLFEVLTRQLASATGSVLPDTPPLADAPAAVDFSLGLRRCLGSADLYRRVQQRFAASLASECDTARAALAAGDRERLARLAHRMISSAGLLGAEPLAATARELQSAELSSDVDWCVLGERYLTQLDEVMLALPA